MVNAWAKLELRRAASWRVTRKSPAGGSGLLLLLLLAARTRTLDWRGREPCKTQGARGGLDLSVRAIQSRPPDGAGKPQPPLHAIEVREGVNRQTLRWVKNFAGLCLALGQAVAGDIGVLRKTASRAATRSETAMPATQAVHPNISKITPSTALPISPPKK